MSSGRFARTFLSSVHYGAQFQHGKSCIDRLNITYCNISHCIQSAYRLCRRKSGVDLVEDDGEAVHVRPLQDGHGRQRAARSAAVPVKLFRLRIYSDFFGVDGLEESGGFAEAQQFRRPERNSEVEKNLH